MDINIDKLLPILVLSGASSVHIALLMVFYPLIKWIFNKIKLFMSKKVSTLEIYDKSTLYRNNVDAYFHIIWFLNSQKLLKYPSLQYEDVNSKSDRFIIISHKTIDYNIGKNKMTFGFYVKKITTEYGKDNETAVINISAENTQIIQDFIKMCTKKYCKYIKTNRDGLFVYSYELNKWKGNELKVIKTFDNLFLSDNINSKILSDIDSFQNNKDLYKKMGISYKRGFLFYGKPGCGKTSTINAIARYVNYDIYKLRMTDFRDSKSLFKAVTAIPTNNILVIEDIDRLNIGNKKYIVKSNLQCQFILERIKKINNMVGATTSSLIRRSREYQKLIDKLYVNDDIEANEIINTVMTEQNFIKETRDILNTLCNYPELIEEFELSDFFNMEECESTINITNLMEIFDGNEYLHNCFIIITSNYPEKLDRALIRSGRIDTHIDFTPADKIIISKILSKFYNKSQQSINKDLKNFDKTIEQSKLINSIILPNINDYQKTLDIITQY